MKKKFKLFATVASISLTLALMVFGVIAATSVNVTISSNVSYTADGVAFKLYGKSEVLASQPSGAITDLTEDTADKFVTVGVTNQGSDSMTLPDRAFTASEQWVVYTFTVENIGSNTIEAILVSCSASDSNVTASNETPTGNLAQGAKESFRCFFKLGNPNATIQNGATSVQITVGHIETTDESYMVPETLDGFSSSTKGNTTTWTKASETFEVTTSQSGSTVTENNTYTNGDKVTTFTTTYDTSTVVQTGAQTFGAQTLSNYVVADRTLRTLNITSGDKGVLVIPDWLNIVATYNASSATSSCFYALRGNLASVTLPSTLETLGNYTFSNFTQMNSISLPAGLKTIGERAFYQSQVASITIPNSVTSIGTYAFADSLLSSLSFGASSNLEQISNSAFTGTALNGDIEIPASVETIGDYAFSDTGITSLSFEEGSSLTTLPSNAFDYASLTRLEIPELITSISGFPNMASLNRIEIRNQTFANSFTSILGEFGYLLTKSYLEIAYSGVTVPTIISTNLTQTTPGVYVVSSGSNSGTSPVSNLNVDVGGSGSGNDGRYVLSFNCNAPCILIISITGDASDNLTLDFDGSQQSFNQEYIASGASSYHGSMTVNVTVKGLGYTSDEYSFSGSWTCLTGDMLVTMADGKKKRLKDLKKGDKVLGVDPLTGKLIVTTVLDTLNTDSVRTHKGYDLWKFSDGTELKTVHRHEFFSMTRSKMVYTDEWEIGEKFIKEDGKVITLVSHETVDEVVEYYNLPTEHHTYFANGILGGDRNTLPMNGESLKF